jgi:hypothetical protein
MGLSVEIYSLAENSLFGICWADGLLGLLGLQDIPSILETGKHTPSQAMRQKTTTLTNR